MKTLDNKNKTGVSELFCVLFVSYNILVTFINHIFSMFIGQTSFDTLLCLAIMGFIGILSLKNIVTHIYVEDFVFLTVFAAVFCLSYVLFPSTQKYVHMNIMNILLNTVVTYIITKGITDTEKFDWYFDRVSVIGVLCTFILLLSKNAAKTIAADEMSIAYAVVLPTVYLFYRWLENKKDWMRGIVFLLGMTVLFISGTRGPFLCVIVFFVLYLILANKSVTTVLLFIVSCVTLVILYVQGVITKWMVSLKVILEEIHFPTRIIDMFLESDLTNDTSRSTLYDTVMDAIVGSPLYGNGILGDRVVTEGLYRYETGTYSHNILLELFCQFGFILGIVLILFVIWLFVKGYRCAENKNEKAMVIMLSSVSVTHLMLSSSYLLSLRFFFAIGYAVVLIQKDKYKKERGIYENRNTDVSQTT